MARLRHRSTAYDPEILSALEALERDVPAEKVMEVDIQGLSTGMVVHEDITTIDGRLLVRKGQRVTAAVQQLAFNFWEHRNLRLPIVVALPEGG